MRLRTTPTPVETAAELARRIEDVTRALRLILARPPVLVLR